MCCACHIQPVCANSSFEIGHLPSWPLIEIRKPCSSSSHMLSTVPAFPRQDDGFADKLGLSLVKFGSLALWRFGTLG
jgi:hypothetical protein